MVQILYRLRLRLPRLNHRLLSRKLAGVTAQILASVGRVGTISRVRTVEEARPPMTTIANGPERKLLDPLRLSDIGISARMVAMAVIRMGRRRRRPPSITASRADSPLLRY